MPDNKWRGFGPLDDLLQDDSIRVIMVNSPHEIYVEQDNERKPVGLTFDSSQHLQEVFAALLAHGDKTFDPNDTLIDMQFPDGSHLWGVKSQASIVFTIEKPPHNILSLDDLVQNYTLTRTVVEVLHACVMGGLNILVNGGVRGGKTTLLNALSSFVPPTERIITIENSPQLKLNQPHKIQLTRSKQSHGLFEHSLHLKPDRLIVDDLLSHEVKPLLNAMDRGQKGTLIALYGESLHDAKKRLE